jgi:hypothetical protein
VLHTRAARPVPLTAVNSVPTPRDTSGTTTEPVPGMGLSPAPRAWTTRRRVVVPAPRPVPGPAVPP